MNFNQLIGQFNYGINLNACFYIAYKSINVLVTFLLYKQLTPYDFTVWAITNSTIYIMLLWSDFGLRKSIPRYSPVFAQDPEANARFIRIIIYFYVSILCILSLLFMLFVKQATFAYIPNKTAFWFLIYCAPAIFITEGITTLFRLLFHAYFFIKQFNFIATTYLITNLILDMLVLYSKPTSTNVLMYIFINKIVVGVAMTITCLVVFYNIKYRIKQSTILQKIAFNKTMRAFTHHTGMMWVNTLLKSLSERNSLVPLIALFGGAESASIFKMANDGALFFQRIVLKTIGTTDTSLLAHIETSNEGEKLLQVAFTKLAQKMAALCLPLIGITLYIEINTINLKIGGEGFHIFILLTLCYLIEMMLMPYERLLEVKRSYKPLLVAYVPYVIFLLFILLFISKTWIGLSYFVYMVYSVRLVSILIMVLLARHIYHVRYPVKYALNLFGLVLATSIGLSLVGTLTNINPYNVLILFLNKFNNLV